MEIRESPGEVSSFTPKTLFRGLLPYHRVYGQLNKFTLYPLNTLLFTQNYLHNFLSSREKKPFTLVSWVITTQLTSGQNHILAWRQYMLVSNITVTNKYMCTLIYNCTITQHTHIIFSQKCHIRIYKYFVH